MKKLGLFLTLSVIIMSFTQCSTMNPKVMACNASCDSAFDQCMEKAGKSEAKKAACEVSKTSCYNECSKQ